MNPPFTADAPKGALRSRRVARRVLAVATIAALGTAGIAWNGHAADGPSDRGGAKPALTVTVVRPLAQDLPVALTANGNIAAWQETVIGAEVAGLRLAEVHVNVGDAVRRGQLLATLNADSVQAELAQQRAIVAEAEATLAEARANAQRAQTLEASGALSAQQIQQYATGAATAAARLEAARAMLRNAELRLHNTRIVANDHGVISGRQATVGSVVQPGQELFRLIRQNRLEWRAELAASELRRVRPGQNVVLTTPAGASVNGKVRVVAPTVDPQTRTSLVYVDLATPSEARAGMYARGSFELGHSAALTVPRQAVVVRDGFSWVFVLKPDSRVERVKVATGRGGGERTEITAGLKADQSVVAAGAGFLNDGDLVAVAQSTPAGGKP